MEIQTRRHILEIWRATVDYCYRDEVDLGRPGERNSISDAEQLLTILYPATAIDVAEDRQRRRDRGRRARVPALAGQRAGHPAPADQVHRRVHAHLPGRRDAGLLRRHLLRVRTTVEATPSRPSSASCTSSTPTRCPSRCAWPRWASCRSTGRACRSQRMRSRRSTSWRSSRSQRLTAAMVGLLRSFTVNTFDPDRPARPDDVRDDQPERCRHRDPRPRPARGAGRDPGRPAAGADDRPRPGGR